MARRKNTALQNKTISSLFIAILIMQTFVPWIGYIPLGPANVTIIHITVIAGGMVLGPASGAMLGLVWGVLSLFHNMIQPTILSPIFLNPLVSVLPRVCVGFLSGWAAKFLGQWLRPEISRVIVGALGTITNTSLVIIMTALLSAEAYAKALNIPETAVLGTFVGALGLNFIFEIIAAAVLVPIIGSVFDRVRK
ncbi:MULTISPECIES: ECF transporter S component [Aerococcus]|uniref:ECF transporter S component n=1 Tax=Aerococcus tenax TaxID=3078812 RepID=A0A5N1BQJ9_9LACT|nr:ECF transporter S component [Aerococcus urinae]KAA9242006.1 ECF transporter S component [Aerococcus urinae]MDK7303057.1 ECF transporter S component [Aerococcus urinae]MDK7801339.1 ECF transporter S component [Aerococcus urinae]MDK8655121.1 ECF transporter S component [Aerococcus urinae]RAV70912.1 ECF transporter S component [Aerococcus urinae]